MELASKSTLCAVMLGLAVAFAGSSVSERAEGSELVFQFTNPGFGGNPLNTSYLISTAELQNKHRDDGGGRSAGASGLTQGELFIRQLESRLLSSLSAQVADAIFGEDAQESGEIVFGEQTIEFFTTLEATVITVNNTATGESTRIEIPVLQ